MPANTIPAYEATTGGEFAFDSMLGTFQDLKRILIDRHDRQTFLIFVCRRGRHRSMGLLAMFLMWATQSHTAFIPKELLRAHRDAQFSLPSDFRGRPKVAFRFVIAAWGRWLDRVYPAHRAPSPER